jgi:hypothetical protein
MPLYSCELCNYSTKFKADFTKHTNTKKHRNKILTLNEEPKEQGVMNTNEHKMNTNEHKMNTNEHSMNTTMNTNEHKMNTKSYKCLFCDVSFNTKASKRRHEKRYCKDNPDFVDKIIDAKNSKIKALEEDKEKWEQEKQELYKQVSKLLDKVGDTNIQNNIILNNYGSEDLSHITDTVKNELIKIPYFAIPKMIEAIHFNDQKPENKNIMIPNKKENLVKIFQGDKWIYKNKTETISDLVDSKYNIIDDHYEVMDSQDSIAPNVKTTFTKFKKIYEDDDAEMIERLRKECELVLLNNR